MFKMILAVVAGLTLGTSANSSVLYSYIGPDYVEVHDGPTLGTYTTTMHVEFQLQFETAIEPNTEVFFGTEYYATPRVTPEFWSVSDGRYYWDSNISGPFGDNPPWVPRFNSGRLTTDDHGNISIWLIEFAIHNYYPEEHPVPFIHRVYSEFPPRQPESPSAIHDFAQVSIAVSPSTGEFDDGAFTNRTGTWQKAHVVPIPSGIWLLLSSLPLALAAVGRARKSPCPKA